MKFLDSIESALKDINLGKIIIIIDDENRENEGDFVVAAEKINANIINFFITYGRGLVCVPLTEEKCDLLNLPLMVKNNTDPRNTAFTVSVDLKPKYGITTGISCFDRSKTILALINEKSKSGLFNKPGHIFPLRSNKGGVLVRPGHTEAAVDISKMAGCLPGGVIVEIIDYDGKMAKLSCLLKISKKFNIKIISISDIIKFKLKQY